MTTAVDLDDFVREHGYTQAINILGSVVEQTGKRIDETTPFIMLTWWQGRACKIKVNPDAEHHREFFETALAKRRLKKLHDKPNKLQWSKQEIINETVLYSAQHDDKVDAFSYNTIRRLVE